MMASMRHPNVVMYLGVCTDPPLVVTEYCARGSLCDVLKRAGHSPATAAALDWPRRLAMALDAAKGMTYLHSSDPPVIHRDLKSPNLLVDRHWRVKVCDFNLSRVLEESAVVSSPYWIATVTGAGGAQRARKSGRRRPTSSLVTCVTRSVHASAPIASARKKQRTASASVTEWCSCLE